MKRLQLPENDFDKKKKIRMRALNNTEVVSHLYVWEIIGVVRKVLFYCCIEKYVITSLTAHCNYSFIFTQYQEMKHMTLLSGISGPMFKFCILSDSNREKERHQSTATPSIVVFWCCLWYSHVLPGTESRTTVVELSPILKPYILFSSKFCS